jgi:orotate phosphoribosyltransferase-like protein
MIYLYVTMSHSSIIRLKAEELRRQGFSLNEISHKLGISKSTASVWLKNIQISSQG